MYENKITFKDISYKNPVVCLYLVTDKQVQAIYRNSLFLVFFIGFILLITYSGNMIHEDIISHMDLVLEEQTQTDIFNIDMQIFNKMF